MTTALRASVAMLLAAAAGECTCFNSVVEDPDSGDSPHEAADAHPLEGPDAGPECPAAADWFQEAGQRFAVRQRVDVVNPGNRIPGVTELAIRIDTASLIAEGLMQPDCSDARFVRTDVLPSLLDGDCNTGLTRFWVQLDGIEPGTSSLWFYSGSTAGVVSTVLPSAFFGNRVADSSFCRAESSSWQDDIDCRGLSGCSVSCRDGAERLSVNCCNPADPNGTHSGVKQRINLDAQPYEVLLDIVGASCGHASLRVCADPVGAPWCTNTLPIIDCANLVPGKGIAIGWFSGGDVVLSLNLAADYGSNGSGTVDIDNVLLRRVPRPEPSVALGARERLAAECRN